MHAQRLKRGAIAVTSSFLLAATAATADIRITFIEGAPKDTFRIENTGTCAITGGAIVIDLSTSQGGLVFDVTATGQGVEVFQPFEITQGAASLVGAPTVVDGQTQVQLNIQTLAANDRIAFTIDVDDTIGQRAITVSGSEIQGATASYVQGAKAVSAPFSTGAVALVTTPNC